MSMRGSLLAVRAPSFVVTPAVVGHRGASGYRPEHTLAAHRLAIAMGADDIELDLMPSRDGHLVVRHDSELGRSTDVAARPEFAARRTTKVVDGRELTGWFVEDFTLAELRTLTAREPMPRARPHSATYGGLRIATFDEVLAMVREESGRRGRSIGILAELKHAAYFDSLGLPLEAPLLEDLRRHRLDHSRSRVSVMSFEPTVLQRLAGSARVPLIQLLDHAHEAPADLVAAGDPRTYADLVTPAGLAQIDRYADGVGAHKELVLGTSPDGELRPTSLVRDAHRAWLSVHVWTLRAENRFLSPAFRSGPDPHAPGDLAGEARLLLELGVDGLITDHPDVCLAARDAWFAPEARVG